MTHKFWTFCLWLLNLIVVVLAVLSVRAQGAVLSIQAQGITFVTTTPAPEVRATPMPDTEVNIFTHCPPDAPLTALHLQFGSPLQAWFVRLQGRPEPRRADERPFMTLRFVYADESIRYVIAWGSADGQLHYAVYAEAPLTFDDAPDCGTYRITLPQAP